MAISQEVSVLTKRDCSQVLYKKAVLKTSRLHFLYRLQLHQKRDSRTSVFYKFPTKRLKKTSTPIFTRPIFSNRWKVVLTNHFSICENFTLTTVTSMIYLHFLIGGFNLSIKRKMNQFLIIALLEIVFH